MLQGVRSFLVMVQPGTLLKIINNLQKSQHSPKISVDNRSRTVYPLAILTRLEDDMAISKTPRKIFNIKLSDAERAELEAWAKALGHRFLSECMRTKLLEMARQAADQPKEAGI